MMFLLPKWVEAPVKRGRFRVEANGSRSILKYWIEIGIDGWELTHVEVSRIQFGVVVLGQNESEGLCLVNPNALRFSQ